MSYLKSGSEYFNFRNMGSKLVERVRRSLSRGGRDRTPEAPLAKNEDTSSPLEEEKGQVTKFTTLTLL